MVTRDEMLAGLNLSGIQTPPRQIGRAEMLAGLQLGSQQPQPAAPFTPEQLAIFRGAHPPERENPFDFAGPLGDFMAILDKSGAIVRSTIKEIGDIFVPGESLSARDWWKQVEGNYVGGEILQDWGVDLPGPLDFVAGITFDIVTDPLTYLFGTGAWARMFKHGFHWERGALAMSGVAGKFDDAAAAALKIGNAAEETAAKATAAMLRDSAAKVIDAKALSAAPLEALEAIGLQKGLGMFVPGTGRLGRFFRADELWDAVTNGAITAKRAKQASKIPVSEAIWGTKGNPKVIQHLKGGGALGDDFVRETTENAFTKRPWNYTVEQITERMKLLKAGGLVDDLDDPLLTVIARKAMVSPVELLSGPAWTGKVVGAVGSAPGKMARSLWRRPVANQAQLSFGEQLDKAFSTRQPIKSLLRNGNQQVQLYGLELNAAVNDGWRAKSTLLGMFAPKVQRQRRIARDLGMTSEQANAFMQMDFRAIDPDTGKLFDLTLGRQTRPLEDMIDPKFRSGIYYEEGSRWAKYVNDPQKLELWAENRQWWDDIHTMANHLPGAEDTPWLRKLLDDMYVARMLHPEFQSGKVNTVRIPGQGGPRPTRARDYVGGRDKFRGVELLRQQDHPKQLSVVEQMREITVAQLGDKAQELFEGDLWQIMDRYMHVISDEVKRQTTMYSLEGRGVAFRTPQSWMQNENQILQNALYDLTGKRERVFDDMFDAIDEGLNPELAAQARAAQLIEEGGTLLESELARLGVEASMLEPELVRVYTALADNLDELRRTVKAGRAERGAVRDYLAKFAREASVLGRRREEIKQTLAAVQLERTRQGGTPIGDALVTELESNLQAMNEHLRVALFEATELSEYSDEVASASEIWRVLTGGYEGHDWGVLDKALQPWARRVDDLREVMDDVDYQALEPITMEQLPRWMSQVQDDGAAVGEYFRRMKVRHATPKLEPLRGMGEAFMPLTPVEQSLSFGGRPQRMTTIYDIYGGPVVGDTAGPRPFRPPPKGDPPPYSPTGVEPPPVGGGAIGDPPVRRPGRLWDEPTTVAEATTQSLASSSRQLDYPVQTPRVVLSEAMDVAFEEIDIIRLEAGQRGAAVFTDPLDARVGEMLDAGVLRVGGDEAAEQVLEFYPRSYDDYLSLRAWVRGKGVPVLTPAGVQEPMYALLDTSELLLVNRFGDLAGDELRWLRTSIDDGDITIGQLTSQQPVYRNLQAVEGEGPLLRAVDPRRPTLQEAIDLNVELPFPPRGGPGGPGGPSLRAIEGGGLRSKPTGVLISVDLPLLRKRITEWQAAQQELLDLFTRRGKGGVLSPVHPSQLDDELQEIMNRIDRLRFEIERLWTPPSGGAEVAAGAELKWTKAATLASRGKELGLREPIKQSRQVADKKMQALLNDLIHEKHRGPRWTMDNITAAEWATDEGKALAAALREYEPKWKQRAVFADPPMGHSAHVRAANGRDVDVWFIERLDDGNWLITVNGREVGRRPKLEEAKAFAQEEYAAGAGQRGAAAPAAAPAAAAERAGAVVSTPGRRKVIASCSLAKCPTGGRLVKARDLYTGSPFKKMLELVDRSDVELGAIASAKHGWLDPAGRVGHYDVAAPRSVNTLYEQAFEGPEQLQKFVDLLGAGGFPDEVLLYGGKAYTGVMRRAIKRGQERGLIPSELRVVEATGGRDKSQSLRTWIDEKPPAAAARVADDGPRYIITQVTVGKNKPRWRVMDTKDGFKGVPDGVHKSLEDAEAAVVRLEAAEAVTAPAIPSEVTVISWETYGPARVVAMADDGDTALVLGPGKTMADRDADVHLVRRGGDGGDFGGPRREGYVYNLDVEDTRQVWRERGFTFVDEVGDAATPAADLKRRISEVKEQIARGSNMTERLDLVQKRIDLENELLAQLRGGEDAATPMTQREAVQQATAESQAEIATEAELRSLLVKKGAIPPAQAEGETTMELWVAGQFGSEIEDVDAETARLILSMMDHYYETVEYVPNWVRMIDIPISRPSLRPMLEEIAGATPAARVAAEEVKAVPYQLFDGHVTGTPQTLDDLIAANPNMTHGEMIDTLVEDWKLAAEGSEESRRIQALLDELEPPELRALQDEVIEAGDYVPPAEIAAVAETPILSVRTPSERGGGFNMRGDVMDELRIVQGDKKNPRWPEIRLTQSMVKIDAGNAMPDDFVREVQRIYNDLYIAADDAWHADKIWVKREEWITTHFLPKIESDLTKYWVWRLRAEEFKAKGWGTNTKSPRYRYAKPTKPYEGSSALGVRELKAKWDAASPTEMAAAQREAEEWLALRNRVAGEAGEAVEEAVEAPIVASRVGDEFDDGISRTADAYAEKFMAGDPTGAKRILREDYHLSEPEIEWLERKYGAAVDEAVEAPAAARVADEMQFGVTDASGWYHQRLGYGLRQASRSVAGRPSYQVREITKGGEWQIYRRAVPSDRGGWVALGDPTTLEDAKAQVARAIEFEAADGAPAAARAVDEVVAPEANWLTDRSVPAPTGVEPPKPPSGPRVIRGADGEPLEQFVVGTPYGDFVIGRRFGSVKEAGQYERGLLPIPPSGRGYEIIDVPFEVPRYEGPQALRGSYRGMVPEGPSSQRLLGAGRERGETVDALLARIERWAEARFAEQQVPLAQLETVDNPRMRAILEELTGYTREGGPATGRLPSNMVMGAHLADEGPMPAAGMVERAFLTQEAAGQFAAAAQLSEEGATLSAEIALLEGRMHQLASQVITRRGAINTDAYQAYIKRFEEARTVRGFQDAVFDGASSQFNGAVPFWGEGWDIAGSAEARLATWDALVKLNEAAVGPKNFPTFLKNYDKFLNYWKAQAVSTPGFIIRNMMGGTWINYAIGGVDFGTTHKFTGMYWRALRAGQGDAKEGIRLILNQAKQNKVKSIDVGLFGVKETSLADWEIMQQVFEGGVFSGGQVITEVERGLARRGVTSFTPGERMGKALPVKPGQSIDVVWNPASVEFVPFRAVRTMNEQAEVVMRGALAFDVLKKGGSLTEAVDEVFRLHFNYADLTRFERQVARRMIPFWKWQRSVLPLMAESVGRNPTAWTRLFHLKGEMELTSKPERNAVPDYYLEQLGMRLPWKINGNQTYWVPDFPFKDFLRLGKEPQDLVRMFAESAGPPVKLPLEIWAKKQFFADIPFSGRFQQVPPVYRNIPFLMEGLSLVGKAEKNRSGEWKMRDHDIYNMESWVPFLARFRRLFPDEDRYKRRQVSTVLSVVFGTQVRINDKYEQRNQMLRNDRAFAKTWQDIYDLELRTM